MIRVLHIVGSMHPGGMENFVMNLYRNIDRSKIQFDFVVHDTGDEKYTKEIESMGGNVYLLPRLTAHPFRNLRQIKQLVLKNGYVAAVRHTPNALVAPQLLAAKHGGCVAICHSHSTSNAKLFIHKMGRIVLRHSKIERFACSIPAGEWMYGDRECTVVHNAIDLDKYAFNSNNRETIREEFGLNESQPVYGHVANFVACKNHTFLMKVYAEIAKLQPEARFFCVGDGGLRKQIEEEAKMLGIGEKVFFTGMRPDSNALMSAMDVLIFPSIYEGLPLTLIEAQAAGLPILASDTINPEAEVTEGLCHWKSISDVPEEWAQEACVLSNYSNRICQRELLINAGYDIRVLARWYEQYFSNISESNVVE